MATDIMRICPACNKLAAFSSEKAYYCKRCKAEVQRAWAAANPEKVREINRRQAARRKAKAMQAGRDEGQ